MWYHDLNQEIIWIHQYHNIIIWYNIIWYDIRLSILSIYVNLVPQRAGLEVDDLVLFHFFDGEPLSAHMIHSYPLLSIQFQVNLQFFSRAMIHDEITLESMICQVGTPIHRRVLRLTQLGANTRRRVTPGDLYQLLPVAMVDAVRNNGQLRSTEVQTSSDDWWTLRHRGLSVLVHTCMSCASALEASTSLIIFTLTTMPQGKPLPSHLRSTLDHWKSI